MVDDYELSRIKTARRLKVYGEAGRGAMTRLAKTFPSLENAPGVNPWNQDELLKWAASGVLSHGEVLAAKFILAVWNPSTDWEEVANKMGFLEKDQSFKRFDLFEAMNVWDPEHVAAARQWMDLCFFP